MVYLAFVLFFLFSQLFFRELGQAMHPLIQIISAHELVEWDCLLILPPSAEVAGSQLFHPVGVR